MSPHSSLGSRNPENRYLPAILGILVHLAKRLGLIVAGVLTGVVVWLVGVPRTDKTMDHSQPDVQAMLPSDRSHDGALDQPRNLNGKIIIISHNFFANPSLGHLKALKLLRMQPENATRQEIAVLLGIPVGQVAPDQPFVELLIAEVDPAFKAKLIAELGTESATPSEVQSAARSLGIQENKLFILSRHVPVTPQMLQHGSQDQEVKILFDTARVYASNAVQGQNHPLPENHTAKLAWIPHVSEEPASPEINLRALSPGSLPLSVRRGKLRP